MSGHVRTIGLGTLLAFLIVTPGLRAEENPFKKAKVGDWVSYEMKADLGGQKLSSTMKQTVKDKNDKEVTMSIEVSAQGQNFPVQDQKIPLDKPFNLAMVGQMGGGQADVQKLEEGKETLTIGDKQYACTWQKMKITVKQFNLDSTTKVWSCPDVPLHGMVKMESEIMGRKVTMELTGSGKGK